MRAATVVQVLRHLFYVLLQLLVVAAIILGFKFYCKFYCMFYITCDRSLRRRPALQRKNREQSVFKVVPRPLNNPHLLPIITSHPRKFSLRTSDVKREEKKSSVQ